MKKLLLLFVLLLVLPKAYTQKNKWNNVIIRSNATDSFGRVTYLWNTGDTGIRINHITAGTYTVTATDGYGCSASASFVVNALTNPILLPTISYQPYTTCDLRADSVVFRPNQPPLPHYTYTWTATNIATGYPSSGIIIGGTATSHQFPIHFADSLLGSTIIIRATDSNGCYDEIKIWIEPCCVRANAKLISNTNATSCFASYPMPGYRLVIDDTFRVNGRLIIDENIKFTNCTFYMEAFSEIVIQNNITANFHGSTLVACDTTMWRGILLRNQSLLIAEPSNFYPRIYDALVGISTSQKSVIDATYLQMNRNWIDIDIRSFGFITDNPSRFRGCNFFSHNETSEHFGNTIPRSGGRCWYPHREEQSSIGIRINLNKKVTIGDTSIFADYTNTFEDKNYGIYSTASGIEVKYNQFNNMRVLRGTIPTLNQYGDAIYFEGLNDLAGYDKIINVYKNNFSKIQHAAINMTGSNLQGNINHNRITTSEYGVYGTNLTNVSSTYFPLFITDNNINQNSIGIGLINIRKMNIHIIRDTITASNILTLLSGSKEGVKLNIVTVDGTVTPMFRIDSNRIFNGLNGIYILSSGILPLGIMRNEIRENVISSTLEDYNFTGIYLKNSHNIWINNNSIQGRSWVTADRTNSLYNKKGILLTNSRWNIVNCNNMDYMYSGFTWVGDCSMPNGLFGNDFNNLRNHIYCASSTGQLWNQLTSDDGRYAANRFNNRANYSIRNLGVVFDYANIPSFPYDPTNPLSRIIFPTGVNLVAPTSSSIYTCASPHPLLSIGEGGSGDGNNVVEQVAKSIIEADIVNTDESLNGETKMNLEVLYDMIKIDSTLLNDDSIAFFYDYQKEVEIGKLDELKTAIYEQDFVQAEEKLKALNTSTYVEEANARFYAVITQIENRATTQINSRDSILIDTIDMEINPKIIDKKYYILTETELAELLDLASLCPIRYGQAVYSARVIINTQNNYENKYWDDDQICIEGINYKRDITPEEDKIEIVENSNIEIHPNPTSKELYFNTNNNELAKCNEIISYSIYDGGGRKISSDKFDTIKKSGNIDVSSLVDGLYIIYFNCSDNTRVMFKFVVN